MSSSRSRRTVLATWLDVAVFCVGLAVGLPAVIAWLEAQQLPGIAGAVAVGLVVVMSRFPLVLTHRSGDVVIGFETCSLVFLVLTVSPTEALALWAIGMSVAQGTSRKPWRSRLFNVGLTVQGGGLLILAFVEFDQGSRARGAELAAVLLGCAVYFIFDLLVTASSLALEDGSSLGSALRWRSVPLGLACFVSVDTLGYLAALLQRSQPDWTLLLLLVPVGTILVAVRSISRAKLAQRRLAGLLEASTRAPEWSDEAQIERALIVQAEQTLRHTSAELRATAGAASEISVPIVQDGQPPLYLVVRRLNVAQPFDADDQAALEALAAIGVAALHRRRLADEMSYLARHDALTGLHNRAVFTDRLARALQEASDARPLAVLYCDLDGFKEVNDVCGHEAGDRLLVAVADRVLGCLRPGDTAARLGGDEFGILLDNLTDEHQAEQVAERLLTTLSPPFFIDGRPIKVQASIGIACADREPVTAEVLLHSADTAMYAAKAQGKGRSERFVPAMRAKDLDRLELEAALRGAVADGTEIAVHYQPVINLWTGQIEGFEALARWVHPTLGAIPPDTFIPMAERLGLIQRLGLTILQTAHKDALQMSRMSRRPLRLAVNVSALQLNGPSLADQIAIYTRENPEVTVILELTESTMLSDDASTVNALYLLKESGALLAIDDFGTGYSSIGYLQRLPLDILKIDKVFLQHLNERPSLALLHGVIAMARAMNLTVVTEGIEDWDNARIVKDLGCGLAQGYLFGRPVPFDQAQAMAVTTKVDISPLGVHASTHANEAPTAVASA